jgi:hypothetical protein
MYSKTEINVKHKPRVTLLIETKEDDFGQMEKDVMEEVGFGLPGRI